MKLTRLRVILPVIIVLFWGVGFPQTPLTEQQKEDITNVKAKQDVPEIPLVESRITFDYAEYDFGEVPPGAKVTCQFPVANNGQDTLIINKIKPGCGCTTTKTSGLIIPPGQKSVIDITYHASSSTKKPGNATKSIKVYSNDSSNPTATLKIKSKTNVEKPLLRAEPNKVEAGDILFGKDGKYEIVIANNDSIAAELEVVTEPSKEYIKKYSIKDAKLKSLESTKLELDFNKNMPMGDFLTTITVQEKGKSDTRISIPITGKIVEKLPDPSKIVEKVPQTGKTTEMLPETNKTVEKLPETK